MCFCICAPRLCCFPSIFLPCLSCLPLCIKGLKCCQCLVVHLDDDFDQHPVKPKKNDTKDLDPPQKL
uniref:SFRICE_005879 n=1 Tax=Spodoptera frugiperda TaxID=7108 RepID=A0A2H1WAH5_SPOFR